MRSYSWGKYCFWFIDNFIIEKVVKTWGLNLEIQINGTKFWITDHEHPPQMQWSPVFTQDHLSVCVPQELRGQQEQSQQTFFSSRIGLLTRQRLKSPKICCWWPETWWATDEILLGMLACVKLSEFPWVWNQVKMITSDKHSGDTSSYLMEDQACLFLRPETEGQVVCFPECSINLNQKFLIFDQVSVYPAV